MIIYKAPSQRDWKQRTAAMRPCGKNLCAQTSDSPSPRTSLDALNVTCSHHDDDMSAIIRVYD